MGKPPETKTIGVKKREMTRTLTKPRKEKPPPPPNG